MPTLTIGDQKVTVGDEFLKLSPDQQNSTVEEIAKSLGVRSQQQDQPRSWGDTAIDAGKSFGRGLAKGAIGLAGLPGDVREAVNRGLDWATGASPPKQKPPTIIATSPQITRAVEGVTGKFGKPETTAGRYAQSIGEFAATAPLGPGGKLAKAATAIGAGVGAQAGDDAGFGTAGRIVGGVAGGAIPGLIAAETKALQLSSKLPTTQQVKDSGTAAYNAIKNARLKAAPNAVDNLVSSTKQDLDTELLVPISAPKTYRALEQMRSAGGDIGQIMGVRQKLREIKPSEGSDHTAAVRVVDAIDNFVENLHPHQVITGDPKFTAAMLRHATASWRSYKLLDQIETAREIGAHMAATAGTGANAQNAMRQRIRSILDSQNKSRYFSKEAKEKMENIVMGSRAANAARNFGKFAPTGPVTAGGTVVADIKGGHGVATAFAGITWLSKILGTYLTKRQIDQLEDIIRSESPIGAPIARANAAQKPNFGAILPSAALRSGIAAPQNVPIPGAQREPPAYEP